MADWSGPFFDPIEQPDGRKLHALRDAATRTAHDHMHGGAGADRDGRRAIEITGRVCP